MIDIRRLGIGESLDISESVEEDIPASFGVGEKSQIAFSLRLTNAGSSFTLVGDGRCCVSAECCLCLAPVDLDFSFQISENYVEQGEADVSDDDIVFSDKHIDVLPAIRRGLYADMPTKPLCSADCAGLCPNCGADLNQGEDSCSCGGRVNAQFSELLQMFDD